MKTQLLFVLFTVGLIHNISAMETNTPKQKKSIFRNKYGSLVIGLQNFKNQNISIHEHTNTAKEAEIKEKIKENRKPLDSGLFDTDGNLNLYFFLLSFEHNKTEEGKKSLNYFVEEPFMHERDCKWLSWESNPALAFQQELEYLRRGKDDLEKDLNNVPWYQKIWNYRAYQRSKKSYECLKEEIDIFENKNNKLYKTNKKAFRDAYQAHSSYYRE